MNTGRSTTVLAAMKRPAVVGPYALALSIACPGEGVVEPTGDGLFDPAHVVVVDIEMRPADWDALRTSALSRARCCCARARS